MKKLPFHSGNEIARVDGQAARRDDRVPVVDRLLEPLGLRRLVDRLARILLAVADRRPAVVLAALDEVELVAAARAHLDDPQPVLRVERRREDVAVAERPDLRAARPCASTNGLSFGTEPSGWMRTTLPKWLPRSRACTRPSRIERSPSSTNSVPSGANTRRPPACLVDSSVGCMRKMTCEPFDLRLRAVDQLAARDREPVAALARLVVAPVDEPVARRSPGSSSTSSSPPWSRPSTCGKPGDRRDFCPCGVDDEELAGRLLGHEQAAVGQERDRPGLVEARSRSR